MELEKYNNVEMISSGEAYFPELLKEIKNCPKQLYYIGNIKLLNRKCAAVVGSRTTNVYGRQTAEAIGARLAERGITVVSGMARGIDSCAHRGALNVRGNTCAVLGCGPDLCYPPENINIKKEIEQKGILVSEYEPGTKPERYYFPERNRIISGLSNMTIVVQARGRSGALITAELAAEQGREVFALPGNIDSQYNLGNNKLIKEGATPIISIDDLLEPLGVKEISFDEAKSKLSPLEYQIFCVIAQHGELTADEIGFYVKRTPAYINPILSVIEMKGFIFAEMGKFFLANV